MLGRVVTWIFYAVVFFFLGVWAGPKLPDLTTYTAQGWTWLSQAGGNGGSAVDTKPATEPATTSPAPQVSDDDQSLAAARKAFQNGDVAGAVSRYRTIIAVSPGNIQARGELGNVLYSTGQLGEAAQVFFDLAAWQLDRGDAAAARALEPAIRRGNAALADELVHRLGAAPIAGTM